MIGCLCIHGFTGGPHELEPLANFLKEQSDWHVVIPSLPGHGDSLQITQVTYQQWIKEAEDNLLQLSRKCDVIYLIGFSMGGMIAAYLAAKYDIKKLVLLSPSRRYISVKQRIYDVGKIIRGSVKGELKNKQFLYKYFSKKGVIPLKAVREFIKCMRFTKPFIKQVECPVLIAQGLQDSTVPYTSTHYLDKEIPVDSKVIYFNDSRHHICLGPDKDILINKVYDFLR